MAATHARELLGEERRELILRWLAQEGKVRATDLAQRLGVSLDTVRRDLPSSPTPAAAPRARRRPAARIARARGFVERLPDDVAAKAAIAQAAVGLVRARRGRGALRRDDHARVRAPAAHGPRRDRRRHESRHRRRAGRASALTVDVVGGRLHPTARTVIGPEAVDALALVRPDVCVLTACSLHPYAGLTLRHPEEAAVVRAMIEGAGRVVSLTTAVKLGTTAPTSSPTPSGSTRW